MQFFTGDYNGALFWRPTPLALQCQDLENSMQIRKAACVQLLEVRGNIT